MGIREKGLELIKSKNYKEAGKVLDQCLKQDSKDHLCWYYRGIVSLRARNYHYALECFEKALSLRGRFEYYKLKGITYLEMLEFENAIHEFNRALNFKEESEVYFYIGVCHVFLDDHNAKIYMKKAYEKNKKRFKLMLKDFYDAVLKDSWELTKHQKDSLVLFIDSISA